MQAGRASIHSDDVGIDELIARENVREDLNVVVESFGKERAYRAVDKSGSEHFLESGSSFAFEESSRELTGGGDAFAIVAGKREEIGARLAGRGGCRA